MKKTFVLFAFAATIAVAVPAAAEPTLLGLDGTFQHGGYDAQRACAFYRLNLLPAPKRCHGHFFDYYGHAVLTDGDFVFPSQASYDRWHANDDFRRWKNHDFSPAGEHRRNGY